MPARRRWGADGVWRACVLALLLLLLCAAGGAQAQILGWGLRTKFKNFLKKHGVLSCGFVNNAVDMLDNETVGLRSQTLAQEWAVNMIVDAFEAHRPAASRDSGGARQHQAPPMFLFFVGPTGVGKTFTAGNIASLIHDTDREPVSLHAENYLSRAVDPEVHRRQIRELLRQKLADCGGRHVVIFDEVQKVAPGTLEVFSSILEHGQLEYLDEKGKIQKLDCHGTIFIFISDLGHDKIIEASIIEEDSELNMRRRATDAIIEALSIEAESVGILKNVRAIVPFRPLRQADVELIVRNRLEELPMLGDGSVWKNITFTDNFCKYLSHPPFINYLEHSAVQALPDSGGGSERKYEVLSDDFAESGARKVAVAVDLLISKMGRMHRQRLHAPAHFHFSLVDDSRCDVNGMAHYQAEISACVRSDEECAAHKHAWTAVFQGDLQHD